MPEYQETSRRVVITGLGAVTPLGPDLASSVKLLAAASRFPAADPPQAATAFQAAAMKVRDFDPRPYFSLPKAIKLADRKAQLAVAAAVMAYDDAGLEQAPHERERLGISMGAGNVELQVEDLALAIGPGAGSRPAVDLPYFAQQILSNLNPLWLLVSLPNMISAHVSIQLQALGPNTTLMTDWIAGAQAVGEAWLWIRSGEADCVLAGGADSGISPLDLLAWRHPDSELTAFEGCAPGEGSAAMVLEERQHALDRQARIYGEVVSFSTAGASGSQPGNPALARCMAQAMRDAGWTPESVDLVCTAAGSFGEAREAEMGMIRRILGRSDGPLPVVEFKSQMGHLMAACTPAEIAMLLRDRWGGNQSTRLLCNAAGSQGQGACIAVDIPGMPGRAGNLAPQEVP